MIKDIVVNLNVGARANPAGDYAISVAEALDAHLTGIVFLYGPIMPVSRAGYVPPELEVIERHNEAAIEAARENFTAASIRASIKAESLTLSASLISAGDQSTSPLSGRRSRKPMRSSRALSKPRCSAPADRSSSFLTFREGPSSWTALWFAGTAVGQRRGRSATPCDGPDRHCHQ
jgi:hypothetical protein